MIVELVGLEVFGRHGVDVALEVPRPRLDELNATVDYRAVAAAVRDVSDRRSYKLIESLAAAVADELAERFEAEHVRVTVRKPGIRPSGLEVQHSAATAQASRPAFRGDESPE